MSEIVTNLTDEYAAPWDAYVHQHPEGSLFHTLRWKEAIFRAFGHRAYYFLIDDNGKIKGVLPIIQLKSRLFGNILSSVPFAAYGGVLADDERAFNTLLEHGKKITADLNGDYLDLKFQYPKNTGLPGTDLYWTFIKELSPDHDANMKAIPRKQRAMVRKGIGSGLQARYSPEYLPQFYEIYAENVQRMGTPVYSKKWFATLLDVFGDDAELMVVEYKGRIVSGVLSFYYKNTVLPYYAASRMEDRQYAPNDFQYWALMCHAVDRGCTHFDYGRSKSETGHFHFKKHWGFEPSPLHYQYYLHRLKEKPELNPTNPKYRFKIEAWKRLPAWAAKLLGPPIVKNIP
ncbi:MAG: FemAB family XrtA/PEP-CTERM system-associated protein [Desulfobulbus sp.]|jgi:FemAB-related protein (PEP-CTERM system-associated)